MNFSSQAIGLAMFKFGKGVFCGFENFDNSIMESISEKNSEQIFEKFIENEIISFDEEIQINALGQHIFNMMTNPEQYIMIDNNANDICVKVFLKNAYYLCITENKKIKSDEDFDRYKIELLPTLDLVVGSFVYALTHKEGNVSEKTNKENTSITIHRKAWDKNRNTVSENEVYGKIDGENIIYQTINNSEENSDKSKLYECETIEMINGLTGWLLDRISAAYEEKEKVNG